MSNSYPKEKLELLIEQEILLSRLYKIFSEEFPEDKDFWLALSDDEIKHSKWLTQLAEAVKAGTVYFDDDKINPVSLNTFVGHLKDKIRRAKEGAFTAGQAVVTALDFERSLIEKNAFACFDSDSKHNKRIILNLIDETRNHIERVEKQRNR